MSKTGTQSELLSATIRKLKEQGYDVVIEPSASILPHSLQGWRPDAVAIGKSPRLVVEIASESPKAAARIADIQAALKAEPDWRLHLVLDRASSAATVDKASDSQIETALKDATKVLAVDARAALLMTWSAFEALSRARRPNDFSRPQSPGRLIEQLAANGEVSTSDAEFLRSMAMQRNRYIHGGLAQDVERENVTRFIELLKRLRLDEIEP